MKFLCGRPGCGKESTATLQIDAPSETVSLVDPRISRDGVPLCARHADATTPPMGWTMNDLRSHNRALAAVPDEGMAPTSTPPRVRPDGTPESKASETGTGEARGRSGQDRRNRRSSPGRKRMSRRQSIEERARQTADLEREESTDLDLTGDRGRDGDNNRDNDRDNDRDNVGDRDDLDIEVNEITAGEGPAGNGAGRTETKTGRKAKGKAGSRAGRGVEGKAGGRSRSTPASDRSRGSRAGSDAPESRPTKRRDLSEEVAVAEDEKFPWHHQYHDDEPEEMQASSPLLSRAFRSSTG